MRAGWSRVTSLSNLLLIPPFPFPFPCAQDFSDDHGAGREYLIPSWMTSPVSDDHGAGREYLIPSWLDPIYTQTQRTIMGRVRPHRGHPFLKFHPQTKEFEWKEKPAPGTEGTPVTPVEEPERKKRGRPRKSSTLKETITEGSSEPCGCDVLVQMVQKPHTVKDNLEEYMDTAKKCKPKPTSSGADAVGS
ncbi:hypothetical protein F2Q70_00002987 [Brassica cretica]|uniref:Uncharacterized protein n=1 Tax=Brassica cretica TaxID=69181 RepID=A0A8S9IKS6_BRACR|nr:hypothetical protein F2Q70_00002987 [Brassica cretica]